MSLLGEIGERIPKIAVEVKSALDEALGTMPDQAVKPEDLTNAVKGRGVQKLEMDQSGLETQAKALVGETGTVKPSQVREAVAANRTDKYEVSEIRGRPYDVTPVARDASLSQLPANTNTGLDNQRRQFDEIVHDVRGTDEEMVAFTETNRRRLRLELEREIAASEDNGYYGDAEAMQANLDLLNDLHGAGTQPELHQFEAQRQFNLLAAQRFSDPVEFNEMNLDEVIRKYEQMNQGTNNQYSQQLQILRGMKADLDYGDLGGGIDSIPTAELDSAQADWNMLTDQFRATVREIGDDSDSVNYDDIHQYISNIEEGINSGRIEYGTDVTEDQLNRLYIQADMEPIAEAAPPNAGVHIANEDGSILTWDDYVTNYGETVEEFPPTPEGIDNFEELMHRARPEYGEAVQDDMNAFRDSLTTTQTEAMDAVVPVTQLVEDAQGELNELATMYGLQAPDAGNTGQVSSFFQELNPSVVVEEEITRVNELQQSYGQLADAIDRGDTTITIPDYNTRQVDPNTRYSFDEDSYRSYALPDTDDASYYVRIYKNPAVDTKGQKYDAHWANKEHTENGVFHVRGDDPTPQARRIQEVQSDIQNRLSKQKKMAIRQWREGSDLKNVYSEHITGSNAQVPEEYQEFAENAAAEINQGMIESFAEALPGHTIDPAGFYNQPLGSLTAGDMEGTILRTIMGGKPSSYFMDAGPAKQYLDAINMDQLGDIDPVLLGELRKDALEELYKLNPDKSKVEVNTILELGEETRADYDQLAEAKIADEKAKPNLRVTSRERKERIIQGATSDPDEVTLIDQGVEKAWDAAHKIMPNADATATRMPEAIPLRLLEDATGLDAREIFDKIDEANLNSLSHGQISDRIKQMGTDIQRIFDLPAQTRRDMREAYQKATEAFQKHINDNADKVLPKLEKFPQAKDYNLDVPFIKQGLQEEIVRAINDGKKEVWLTMEPDGVEKMIRGEGPHANYQTGGSINKTFRSLAKRFGATLEETEDGYLKMVFNEPTNTAKKVGLAAGGAALVAVPAYADTNNQDFINNARAEGVTDEEIRAYIDDPANGMTEQEEPMWAEQARQEGVTDEEIELYQQKEMIREIDPERFAEPSEELLMESDVPTLDGTPTYHKIPNEQVKELAVELKVDPTTPTGIDAIYTEAMKRANPGQLHADEEKGVETAQQMIADLQELYDVDRPWLRLKSMIGYGPAVAAYKEIEANDAATIVELGKERGYDLAYGQGMDVDGLEANKWFVTINGNTYEATPEFFANQAQHLSGEVVGGITAAKEAERYTRGFDATPYTRLARWGIVGAAGIAGAVLGDQVDYAAAAAKQQEEMTWDMALQKAIGSAQTSAVGEVIGFGVVKLGATAVKGVMKAYEFVTNGNVDGAYKIMLEILDITDDEAKDIVQRWEAINQREAPTLSDNRKWYNPAKYTSSDNKEKAIAILPTTRAGGENIVTQVASSDPRASARIASEVNARAKSLVQAAADGMGDSKTTATEITEGMNTYKIDTETWYDVTKTQGSDLAPEGYQFNINTLAVKPLLDDLTTRIYNPQARQAAMNMLERVDVLTNGRTFEDLLELRQLVNKMRSRKGLGAPDHEAFREVMAGIDDEIEKVSHMMGPDGAQWLDDWTSAKAAYGEMKKLTTNALGKILTKPSIKDTVVAKALIKYGAALDGTYTDLVKQLPLDVQPKVEAMIIDQIVNKHTVGEAELKQAVQFPAVARALADYEFIWPEAKALKAVVDEFAEIYQNDVALAYSSGGISTTRFQSYLTTNPVVRLQYEVASQVFNQIKILTGGPQGDATALVKAAARLLEEPLNPSNVKDALDAAQGNAALERAFKDLARTTAEARDAGKTQTTKIKTYKDGNGKLYTQPGAGRKDAESIPMHRMTNELSARAIVRGNAQTDLTELSAIEKARLVNKGITAIGLDDGTVLHIVQ